MSNRDLLIYLAHAAFWLSFAVARRFVREPAPTPAESGAPVSGTATREETAPYSRALLAFHMVAFAALYFGIGNAVLPNRVPFWFRGQRIVGTLVMAVGAVLMNWALLYFRSWRFRAKLDQGHQLATGGPFAHLRHPIYMGLNLLALGSAIWCPTVVIWVSFILMVIGSDLRGRSEEALLARVFGASYTDYAARTKRFVPGIY